MAVKPRREAAVVDVAGVKVGGNHPIVVQSMTNTDTADSASTVNQVMALARAGSELVRVTVNTEQAAAAVPQDRRLPRQVRRARAHHRRFPLQRPHPAEEVSGVRARAGQVPHQSRQRQYRQEARRQFPHHDRGGHRVWQAGAHRRQLGIARSGVAHPHDGRKLAARRAQGRARGDARGHRGERHRIGLRRRALRPARTTRSFSAPR